MRVSRLFFPLCLLRLLSLDVAESQLTWCWQNPLPQGNYLNDICFVDSMFGWAAGRAGTILRTTEGGTYWQYIVTQFPEYFQDVSFVDQLQGWVLTLYTKKVLHTADGGVSWDSLAAFSGPSLDCLLFLNDSLGFVGGSDGRIFRSADGGWSWTPGQTNSFAHVTSIGFGTSTVGWAGSVDAVVLKSTDAGQTWTPLSLPGFFPAIRKVHADGPQHAWAVGNSWDFKGNPIGAFYFTSDGGSSWRISYIGEMLTDVFFHSPSAGWVGDWTGAIFFTTNGGLAWSQRQGHSARFAFGNERKAWGILNSGLIYATSDGWQSSQVQTPAVTTRQLISLSVFDSNHVAVCGWNPIIVGTTNGGRTWTEYYNSDSALYLNDITYRHRDEIWTVGQNGRVMKSTNHGATWQRSTIDSVWFNGITFLNDSLGFIVGDRPSGGVIYHTTDSGNNWILHDTLPTTSSLSKITFPRENLGWIAAQGHIFRSTDLGVTWTVAYSDGGIFTDISTSGDTAWFSNLNRVYLTTDAGVTWSSQIVFPVGNALYTVESIDFTDDRIGRAAASNGRIYVTTDAGLTWVLESQINGNSLWGIRFAHADRGWAVGNGGAILAYGNPITSVEDPGSITITHSFSLLQNYPNPFNATTRIRYELPRASYINLKIFDLLGRLVKALVLGIQPPGIHEIEFNASEMSSGAYFYQIEFPGASQVRKMLLVK